MNDRDEVVGSATTSGIFTKFAWANGVFSQAPAATDGNGISELTAISNRGWSVGAHFVSIDSSEQDSGYSWHFGSATSQVVKVPAGYNIRPIGINSGNVVMATMSVERTPFRAIPVGKLIALYLPW